MVPLGGDVDILKVDRTARIARNAESRLPASLFATHALTPEARFGAWHESMRVLLDSSLGRLDDPAAFSGENESYLLDDLVLTRGIAHRQKFDRSRTKIALDGIDHYLIEVFLAGHTEMNVGRHVVRSDVGRVIGFDLGEVMDSFNSDFDVLCAVVPRARLAPLLARPDSIHGAMPARDSGAGTLLASYLQNLYFAAPLLSPAEGKAASQALINLLASAFNSVPMDVHDSRDVMHQALLLRAQSFIRENLAAQNLSPDTIAAALGISRTVLYRLLEPIGGIAEYVRELRLKKCLADIMSVRCAHMHISEIGFRWGFSNSAHFTRAFRQRFGRAPGEVREAANPTVRRNSVALDSRVGDRRYEEWIAGLG